MAKGRKKSYSKKSGQAGPQKPPAAAAAAACDTAAGPQLFTVREVPGKGLGMIAAQLIPAGTLILSEAPLLSVRDFGAEDEERTPATERRKHLAVMSALQLLSAADQATFWTLSNNGPEFQPRELGTFITNALPAGEEGTLGVYALACRPSHSCNRICHHAWNEDLKRLEFRVFRDIQPGEEVTITYIGVDALLLPRTARQALLLGGHRFACACEVCSMPAAAVAASDERRATVDRLLRMGLSETGGRATVAAVEQILQLLDEERIADTVQRCYASFAAATACEADQRAGDHWHWLEKAVQYCLLYEGPRGETYMSLRFELDQRR